MRPHEERMIDAQQEEARENLKDTTVAAQQLRRQASRRHTKLKIISGSAAGMHCDTMRL